jgi:hypothetical protein
MYLRILSALLVLSASPAIAGDLELRVLDKAGNPVPDAVITVRPDSGVPGGAIRFPWGTTMVQQNIQFAPHVLIVPVGATVSFPNKDKVRHHIYSFSKPAKFDLKLYGGDETRSYTFTSTGAVAIGCNIHDMMSAFIKVVDTPFAGKTSDAGIVRIAGIPAGNATVTIWHPRLRGKDNESVQRVPFAASGTASKRVDLDLR